MFIILKLLLLASATINIILCINFFEEGEVGWGISGLLLASLFILASAIL